MDHGMLYINYTDLKLFFLVCQLVLIEIGRVDKSSRALRTLVGLLSGVGSHMHHQVILVLAFVGAKVAEEVECVCVNNPGKWRLQLDY